MKSGRGGSALKQPAVGLWTWGDVWGGAVSDTENAVNQTQSAVNHFRGSPYVQNAEQTAVNISTNVGRTVESSFDTAKSSVENVTGEASAEMQKQIKSLGDAVASATYEISPVCQDAMEIGVVVVAGGAAPEILLTVLGFTSDGVEAESLAALWQSTIGDVEKGSLFARLQSAAAAGLTASAPLQMTGVSAIAAGAFCSGFEKLCATWEGCKADHTRSDTSSTSLA